MVAESILPRPFESGVEALLPNPVYLLLLLLVIGLAASRLRLGSRWRVIALAAAGWAYLGTTPAISRLLIAPLEQHHVGVDPSTVERGADIVLLASGSVERHQGKAVVRLDAPAWERTAAAAALWKHTGGRLIVLGGPTLDGLSPSLAMAEAAVALGVPADRVSHDDRANTTRAGFQAMAAPSAGTPTPWLITSALHMRRSVLAAQQSGWQVRAYPCDYIATDSPGWQQWFPGTAAYRQNVDVVHEYVGLAYYRALQALGR